jgi:thioredoxin 1
MSARLLLLPLASLVGLFSSTGCGPSSSAEGFAAILAPSPALTAAAEAAVATAPLPQFLNFGADRCIPCKQMVPVREAIAAEYAGQVQVGFIDVWADRDAGRAHGVRVIPTQLILDAEGRELFRHEGYWPKEQVLAQFAALGIELRPVVNH